MLGFAQDQRKTTYGLGFNLTLARNKDKAVIDKAVGIADARIKVDHLHWNVPHHTPSFQQQSIFSDQVFSKTPRELRYVERSVFSERHR